MFFHGIIFTKQGQSHRPTGRGAGSRAATRKPLILLADSGRRILSRGPGICRGSAGDLPGICRGSAGDRARGSTARGSPGDRQGIDIGPWPMGQESRRRFQGSRARAPRPGFTKNRARTWTKKRPARVPPGGPVTNAPDANSTGAGEPQRRPPVYCI